MSGVVVEWLMRQTGNLTNPSHMGSNPVRVKPLSMKLYWLVPVADSRVFL